MSKRRKEQMSPKVKTCKARTRQEELEELLSPDGDLNRAVYDAVVKIKNEKDPELEDKLYGELDNAINAYMKLAIEWDRLTSRVEPLSRITRHVVVAEDYGDTVDGKPRIIGMAQKFDDAYNLMEQDIADYAEGAGLEDEITYSKDGAVVGNLAGTGCEYSIIKTEIPICLGDYVKNE